MSAPPTAPAQARLLGFEHRDSPRRLAVLARNALAAYDVAIDRLTLLGRHQNTMFKLVTTDGRRFVVRVNLPGMRSELDIASEMAWLAALERDTDLVVPRPLPTRNGALMTVASAAGLPEPRAVAVFHWIDGRMVGAALGRLQEHADRFVPPPVFTDSRLDDAWGFGAEPAALHETGTNRLWTDARRALVRRAAERTQATIDALHANRTQLRFLHIDLHSGNAMRIPGGLAVLDFDDSRWAHPVQDVGIPLFYLWVREHGERLIAAFLEGFASVRGDAPDRRTLYQMIAGRQVDLLAFILDRHFISDAELPAYMEKMERRLTMLEALVERG
jgi:Ser/Thr protein kinase RdoA (MazF antagonist)